MDIEESPERATVYTVKDSPKPSFDMVNKVKKHHADKHGVNYSNLAARKIADNKLKGRFEVVVVE